MRLGAPFRQPEWSALALIEAPEYVTKVHRRYIDAGAEIITTNSYAVVPFHIGAPRFQREGAALAALAGRLARAAADAAQRPVRVAGSLPPVCGSYRPDLFDAAVARPILQLLIDALEPYVDVWLSETLSSEAEMVLAARYWQTPSGRGGCLTRLAMMRRIPRRACVLEKRSVPQSCRQRGAAPQRCCSIAASRR